MHIPNNIVNQMADKAAAELLMQGAARGDRAHIAQTIKRALLQEMNVENELMVEVDKILRAHMTTVRAEGADVGKLRGQILAKLAKEKGVVLR